MNDRFDRASVTAPQALSPFTRRWRLALLALLALGSCGLMAQAQAVDASWSGFARLGYARSDSDYSYQRFINRDGTLRVDSLLAGQLDIRLTPHWSATLQMKLAPAGDSDRRLKAQTAWAFVAWRPSNDWLLRAGRARVPLYLHSESLDVGVSHDMARLPHELYSVSPTNDFDGVFSTHSFVVAERDINLDIYGGQTETASRAWLRDGQPPQVAAGERFTMVRVKVVGAALSSRDSSLNWRISLHGTRTRTSSGEPLAVFYPRVDLGQGVGYWKVDAALPGPDIPTTPSIRNRLLTAGAEWQVDDNWRLAGEFVDMRQLDTQVGSDSRAGYLALFRRFGAYTPYLSVARQRSSDTVLSWRLRLTQAETPSFVPGAVQLDAAQRIAGESGYAFDQRSTALGLSVTLSPTAKLKGEWMQTRVGAASGHFDVPAGRPDAAGLKVNTLSVNLSLAF